MARRDIKDQIELLLVSVHQMARIHRAAKHGTTSHRVPHPAQWLYSDSSSDREGSVFDSVVAVTVQLANRRAVVCTIAQLRNSLVSPPRRHLHFTSQLNTGLNVSQAQDVWKMLIFKRNVMNEKSDSALDGNWPAKDSANWPVKIVFCVVQFKRQHPSAGE